MLVWSATGAHNGTLDPRLNPRLNRQDVRSCHGQASTGTYPISLTSDPKAASYTGGGDVETNQ